MCNAQGWLDTVQCAVQAREKSQHNTRPTHGAGSQEVKQAEEEILPGFKMLS